MATMRDVARRAGVSTASVSHVINQTRPVSGDLRQKVLAAMQELEFRPNRLASGLRSGHSKTLGMIMPDSDNPFFAEVARGAEEASARWGFSIILCNSKGDADIELMYAGLLIEKQVDGILFFAAGVSEERLMAALRASCVPMVVTDRESMDVSADFLGIDNVAGGRLATKHLLDLGHRRIACIAGPSDHTPSAGRVIGYRQMLRECDIGGDEELVVKGDWRSGGGRRAALGLLALPDPPTAVFACNDMMAVGAISAAAGLGLRVPGDISVVGFDNVELASFTVPALTTINQPKHEVGSTAVAMLMDRIKAPALPSRRLVFPLELIVRKSSGPARKEELFMT